MGEITLYTLHVGRKEEWIAGKINTRLAHLYLQHGSYTLWINSKCIYREIIAGVRRPSRDSKVGGDRTRHETTAQLYLEAAKKLVI